MQSRPTAKPNGVTVIGESSSAPMQERRELGNCRMAMRDFTQSGPRPGHAPA
jgi:hypothetical protein